MDDQHTESDVEENVKGGMADFERVNEESDSDIKYVYGFLNSIEEPSVELRKLVW